MTRRFAGEKIPRLLSYGRDVHDIVKHSFEGSIAGIDVVEPGFNKSWIQPWPNTSLNFAITSFDRLCGPISSGWERKVGRITVKVTVPCNTSAEIICRALQRR